MPSSVGLSGIRPITPGYAAAPHPIRVFAGVPAAGRPRTKNSDRSNPQKAPLPGGAALALPIVLQLYDTATREVRELASRDPGRVSIYVCGPTVYAPPHLGHGRQNVVYDVLARYLRWRGLVV